MEAFLRKLEEAIKSHLKETYLPPHRHKNPEWTYHDLKFFSKGTDLLSTAFTEDRAVLPKNYFNKKEYRSAYLLYFVLLNFPKVWKCLEQLPQMDSDSKRPLKILDLGSGPGTAALACSTFFKDRPLEVFAFEQNEGMRKDALVLWKKLAPSNHHLTFTRYAIPREQCDIAIAANFLSELPFVEQLKICEAVLKQTDHFIIIEPALRFTTRKLMGLRDKILQNRWGVVLAPCLHQKNCPMLAAGPRDWCHFYIDWKCPYLIRQIDEIVGNKHDYLKMAYLVIASPADGGTKQSPSNQWRIVSSPLLSNGKRELILCGDCGFLKKIDRLNKDRSENNRDFDFLRRGDIIEWPDKKRVERQDVFTHLNKF